jgi:hypothetical protein
MDLLFTGYSDSVESAVAMRRTCSEVFVRVPVCLTGRMSIRIEASFGAFSRTGLASIGGSGSLIDPSDGVLAVATVGLRPRILWDG